MLPPVPVFFVLGSLFILPAFGDNNNIAATNTTTTLPLTSSGDPCANYWKYFTSAKPSTVSRSYPTTTTSRSPYLFNQMSYFKPKHRPSHFRKLYGEVEKITCRNYRQISEKFPDNGDLICKSDSLFSDSYLLVRDIVTKSQLLTSFSYNKQIEDVRIKKVNVLNFGKIPCFVRSVTIKNSDRNASVYVDAAEVSTNADCKAFVEIYGVDLP